MRAMNREMVTEELFKKIIKDRYWLMSVLSDELILERIAKSTPIHEMQEFLWSSGNTTMRECLCFNPNLKFDLQEKIQTCSGKLSEILASNGKLDPVILDNYTTQGVEWVKRLIENPFTLLELQDTLQFSLLETSTQTDHDIDSWLASRKSVHSKVQHAIVDLHVHRSGNGDWWLRSIALQNLANNPSLCPEVAVRLASICDTVILQDLAKNAIHSKAIADALGEIQYFKELVSHKITKNKPQQSKSSPQFS